ncbi:MAG: (2Fe-2S)-binding protein [Ignavibacteria bacterium]|nr:(2Fe-2S)-binding protein [Ignavibacteria bacterium]
MNLNVNNTNYEVNVPSEMPLLWVLRDVLGLTGTKFGCGVGTCGSCVVLSGNEAIRSCSTPVSDCADKKIVTIEGLSNDMTHPLQIAWMQVGVPQCGYCQSGQIMSAAALLMTIPKPTDEDIDREMSSNICRCGTYNKIREAIHIAAIG